LHEDRVIWLNGTFGIGKTTTARLLVKHISGARVFDPEEVGCLLRHVMVHESVDDFQDWPLWRTLVVVTMVEIMNHTGSTLVVPMTVLRPDYAEEIFTGLTRRGKHVTHVLLHADDATLQQRIENSDEYPGRPEASAKTRRWRFSKLDAYRHAYGWLSTVAHVIDTTSATPDEIVRNVLTAVRRVSDH
jgi:broad-specificity NMP kinase